MGRADNVRTSPNSVNGASFPARLKTSSFSTSLMDTALVMLSAPDHSSRLESKLKMSNFWGKEDANRIP